MKICFFLLQLSLFLSCQGRPTPENVKNVGNEIKNANSDKIANNDNSLNVPKKSNDEDVISTTMLKCGGKVFSLVTKYQKDSKIIDVSEGKTKIKTINLPDPSDVNGFSLNWVKEVNNGFEISFEYGSRLYYQKDLSFICTQNGFYLNSLKITTFDKRDPEKSWKEHVAAIKPELPLEKFVITDFIGND